MSAPNQILVAFNRFGLGGRGGNTAYLASAAADPRGFVRAEIDRPQAFAASGDLKPTPELVKGLFAFQAEVEAKRSAAPPEPTQMDEGRGAAAGALAAPTQKPPARPPSYPQQILHAEALARIRAGAQADVGFYERLVGFWSNHFAVSTNKGGFIRVTAGAFEREAIPASASRPRRACASAGRRSRRRPSALRSPRAGAADARRTYPARAACA